jgi:hypothetical protein
VRAWLLGRPDVLGGPIGTARERNAKRSSAKPPVVPSSDCPKPANVRAMVSSWAAGGPTQTQARKWIWQFVGGATITFIFSTMIADSPFRQLASGHFAYGGLLAVLPSVLLIALLAPLVSYRRGDVLLGGATGLETCYRSLPAGP